MKPFHFALVAVLFATGCTWLGTSKAEYERQLQRIEAQLLAEVGEARADSVAQCAVLLYGRKPCGGHWRSLVYSTAEGDQELIQRLAERYTELQDEMNRKFGIISDCALEQIPIPALEGGQCVVAGWTGPDS